METPKKEEQSPPSIDYRQEYLILMAHTEAEWALQTRENERTGREVLELLELRLEHNALTLDLYTAAKVAAARLRANRPKRAQHRRRPVNTKLERIREHVRNVYADNRPCTTAELCALLGNSPRPPKSEWVKLPWSVAHADSKHRSGIDKWVSQTIHRRL
jgi:hypothetical protein